MARTVHRFPARESAGAGVALRAMVRAGVGACLLGAVLAAPAAARAQSDAAAPADSVEVARRVFREGVEAAEAGQWDLARERFERVLRVRATPLVRFNLALACRNSNRLVDAIAHFRAFALDPAAVADTERMTAATTEIAELTARLPHLQVVVSGDAPQGFLLDTHPLDVALLGQDIAVDPGNRTIEVIGRGGDRQVREGNLHEGERERVEITLAPAPPDPVTAPVRTTAPPRAQSFGHWVARPGPRGRWVDWAAGASAAPRSVWERRPFTLAVGLGGGSPVGIASLSMRYFPQRWFGLELAGGGPSGYGAGFLLHAHARVPLAAPSIYAPGVFVGPGINLSGVELSCGAGCAEPVPTRVEHVVTLSLDVGSSHEWRLGDHFTLRLTLGLRWFVNQADLRAVTGGQSVTCRSTASSPFGDSPCGHVTGDAAGLGGFLGLDIGYGIGP